MITKISATNLKGRTFSYDLEPINIIVGENAEGKSAIIDAVLLANLQYHPRIGKQNSDIFKLASGDRMTITTVDTGLLPRDIAWYKSGDSVKFTGDKLLETPPIMLDAKLYFELSPAKRIELVASLVDTPEEARPAQIISQVKNIKLENNSEHSESVLTTICEQLTAIKEINVLRWLDTGLTQLRDSLKIANANRKQMTAVVTGIEQLRAQEQQVVQQSHGVETRLAEARKKIAALQRDAGERIATRVNAVARNNRREQLAQVKPLPESKVLIISIAVAGAEVIRLEKIIKRRKIPSSQIQAAITEKESEIASNDSVCGHLAIGLQKLKTESEATLKHKECPTCHNKSTTWKKDYKAETEKAVSEMEIEINRRRDVVNSLQAELKTLNKNLSDYTAEDQELAKAEKHLAELQGEKIKQSKSGEAFTSAQAELNHIGAAENLVALDTQIEVLQKTITETQLAIDNCEVLQRDLISQRSQTKNQMQATIESQKLDVEIECLKVTGGFLKEKQSELVEKAFDTLLVTVNKFTKAIIPLPILYFNGELGYQNESQFVSADTFSGAEESALFAGLSIALASQSKFKLVMFDEFTRFIGAGKERMIKQLCDLVDKKIIDQVIVCDGMETIYKTLEATRDDCQIIRVNA